MNCRFLMVLPLFLIACNSYQVLVLGPMNGKSHFLYVSTFVRALLDRGHVVTYLTSMSLNHLKLANYTEVLIDPPFDLMSTFSQDEMLKFSTKSVFSSIFMMSAISSSMNVYMYENANVQKFIKSTGSHFDVIVAEEFFADSLYMLVHKHHAPLVTICPFGMVSYIERQQGLLNPSSFVPYHAFPYSDKMSFTERWYNTIVTVTDWIVRNLVFLPAEERLAQKYFAHLAPLPSLRDILLHNISINLVNTHRAISPPRPLMPNIIPIGGAHIKPVKPLPNDLKLFLDGAENGVIYFSLGSVVQSSKLPQHLIQSFLNTFKTLNQRILWKYEDESLDNIPTNVMVRKWMPQNDILAHSNVILFISHGGLFGTTESLYHGVPLLLIPFFGDQFRNAHQIVAAGYGKCIQHQDITEYEFTKTINEIVSDETYLRKANQTSAIFNDNLVHPMDEAMFWIEHVAKFKGAKHVKSHAVNMSWFTYLLLDVILVNVLAILMILFILRSAVKRICCKKSNDKTEKNLQKKRK